MKAIDKMCVMALAVGTIGCVVFGTLMTTTGQDTDISDFFSIHLANGTFGLHFGSGIGYNEYYEEVIPDIEEISEADEEISQLDFEVGTASLVILPGDSFDIQSENVDISTCDMSGGVWTLEAWGTSGINIGAETAPAGEITVTVPADQALDLYMEVSAGTLHIGEITVNDLFVTVGAGSVTTGMMNVHGTADIEVGAGKLDAKMTAPEYVSIDCGMGSVSLELAAAQDAYDIWADCGLGSVTAGSLHIDGVGDRQYTSSNAAYSMDIDCGMGSVKVLFAD